VKWVKASAPGSALPGRGPCSRLNRRVMDMHDYTFTPLDGSGGRRGKVVGQGDCPEEGDRLTLTVDGQELAYEVTFSKVRRDQPHIFDALVVRDSDSLP
jgi:hypothetical protein